MSLVDRPDVASGELLSERNQELSRSGGHRQTYRGVVVMERSVMAIALLLLGISWTLSNLLPFQGEGEGSFRNDFYGWPLLCAHRSGTVDERPLTAAGWYRTPGSETYHIRWRALICDIGLTILTWGVLWRMFWVIRIRSLTLQQFLAVVAVIAVAIAIEQNFQHSLFWAPSYVKRKFYALPASMVFANRLCLAVLLVSLAGTAGREVWWVVAAIRNRNSSRAAVR